MKEATVAASDFKARCLRILDEVAQRGQSVVVTKRGKPIARVIPVASRSKPLKGRWKGLGKTKGDIVYFDSSSDWKASARKAREAG